MTDPLRKPLRDLLIALPWWGDAARRWNFLEFAL